MRRELETSAATAFNITLNEAGMKQEVIMTLKFRT